jgi:hypothetical protein
MLHLHPIDAASAATSQLDRNRRQFRTANTFHAGWSRPAVPASVSRFSSCCRAPRRLRAEGTTRSLRCGGAEDGESSNIRYILVTLETSHLLSGWLKEVVYANIAFISSTLDTSHLLSCWLKELAPKNIRSIFLDPYNQ